MSIEAAPQTAIDGVIVNAYQQMMQARALPMSASHVQVHSARLWEIETETATFNIDSYGSTERGADPLAYHDLRVKEKATERRARFQMTHNYDKNDGSTEIFPDDLGKPTLSTEEVFALAGVTGAAGLSYFLRNHLDGAQKITTRRSLTLITRRELGRESGIININEEQVSRLGVLSGRSTIEYKSSGSGRPFALLASIHSGDSGPSAVVEKYRAGDEQAQPEVLTSDRLQVVRDHLAMAAIDLRRYNQEFLNEYPHTDWHAYPPLAPSTTF